MSTPLRHAPALEPSTDFPTLDLVPPLIEPQRPARMVTITLLLVVAGTLLVSSLGFAVGRSSAGIPSACEHATRLADRTAALAIADLRTVREAVLVFMDGELPEAYSILGDARLGIDRLRGMRAELSVAAEACLAG